MTQYSKITFALKVAFIIISTAGLLLAAVFMLFGLISTFEAGPYDWLYRFVYLLAFMSCLSGVLLLVWWISGENPGVNQISSMTKMVIAILAILAVLGLLIATGYMLVVFKSFLGSNEMSQSFNVEPSYSWWMMALPLLSVFGCVMASIVFVKRLILK